MLRQGYYSVKIVLSKWNYFFQTKTLIMKRLFMILAIAGAMTACNNSADSTEQQKDSLDSLATEKKDRIDSTTEEKKEALDRADSLHNNDSVNKK